MKTPLILFLAFLMPSYAALAKATAPMDADLTLSQIQRSGAMVEYVLKLDFRPWLDAEQAIFQFQVPENLSLTHGFTYWDGPLSKNKWFIRTFHIKAPEDIKGKVKMLIACTDKNGLKSAKVLIMELRSDIKLQKSGEKHRVGTTRERRLSRKARARGRIFRE